MKEVFLLVSDGEACIFLPDKNEIEKLIPLDGVVEAADVANRIKDGLGLDFRRLKLILVANYKKTIIRVVDAFKFNLKRSFFRKKIANSDAWEVIKSVFPLGPSINEETHIFDISFFGDSKLVCFGFPMGLSLKLTEIGKELTGSIHGVHRLETIENLLFAKYSNDSRIIVLPQDDGFRVLTIKDGLPENAFFIGNHPTRREAEFERIIERLGKKMPICMSIFIPFGESDDLDWLSRYEADSFK